MEELAAEGLGEEVGLLFVSGDMYDGKVIGLDLFAEADVDMLGALGRSGGVCHRNGAFAVDVECGGV